MQYFGIPTCPYCRKRVNLIRTWSLKREGEYKCPRCGGISNIYLSPLVYVFSVLAICAGVCIYFFHKFVLDDIELFTCLYIFIPFGIFYLLSLFTVYLKRPVIKRVPRPAEKDRYRDQQFGAPGELFEQQPAKKLRPDVNFPDMNTGRYQNGNDNGTRN
ncbi:MAG: hypothetical protein J6I98_05195 [Clostridia bacterium]|nr:hypothetical protein [Clostridia bacterium]